MRRELCPVPFQLPRGRNKLFHKLLLHVADCAALVVRVGPKLPLDDLPLRQDVRPVERDVGVLALLQEVFQGLAVGLRQEGRGDGDVAEVLVGDLVLVVGRLHRRVSVLVVHHQHRRGTRSLRVPDLLRKLTGAGKVVAHGPAVDEHDEVGRAADARFPAAAVVPGRRRGRREVEGRRGLAVGGAGVVARGLAAVGVAVVRVDVDELAAVFFVFERERGEKGGGSRERREKNGEGSLSRSLSRVVVGVFSRWLD